MTTDAQIQANRRNAQKSTGPKTAEGKAVVAQNTAKNALFAHENVIKCEKQTDFDVFRDELLAGLAPIGGVETMLAERIVSLSWRLRRVERMNSEAIDVMIAKIETDSSERRWRQEAGLLDPQSGKSERVLGWAMIKDFSGSNMLERRRLYEKRIESSLYKAMNELQKLQNMRKKEEMDTLTIQSSLSLGNKAAPPRGRDALATVNQEQDEVEKKRAESEKQSQSSFPTAAANSAMKKNKANSKIALVPASMKR